MIGRYISSDNVPSCLGNFFHRAILAVFLAVFLIFTNAGAASANSRYASIVMDADTGEILSQSNADKQLHPASLTKAMTLLMAFEALKQGRISLNDRVRMSRHAAGMAPSKIGIKAGDSIRVKDAIGALVTKSANDVAAALAEHLGGTESDFARQMTRRARDIGMSRTTFVNASGLHDPKQISTARDMAVMARYIIRNYPEYYRYFSMSNFTYQGRTYRNHNRLMETYKGMDGMKTGYVSASGFNLVASAVRNDRRLIGVVFGGRTTQSRNDHMASLLDQGFEKIGGRNGDIRIAKTQSAAPEKIAANEGSSSVPLPDRKPEFNGSLASTSPSSLPGKLKPQDLGSAGMPGNNDGYAVAAANVPSSTENSFEEASGEGDSDSGISRRIETGLMAIAAHRTDPVAFNNAHTQTTQYRFRPAPGITQASYAPSASAPVPDTPGSKPSWSIQVGAFTSRAATDQTLHDAMRRLPGSYTQARPIIAPLKTADGWLFRARLTGFTKNQALAACNYLRDCLPVAPQN